MTASSRWHPPGDVTVLLGAWRRRPDVLSVQKFPGPAPPRSSDKQMTGGCAVWEQENRMRRGNVVAAEDDFVVLPADRGALPGDADVPERRA